MSLPIYKEQQTKQVLPEFTNQANAGLWFDRFFDQFDGENQNDSKRWQVFEPKSGEDKGITYWLTDNFTKKVKKAGNDALVRHATKQLDLAEKVLKGKALTYKASWHFVTGMGNPHPVENGFTWHPTLGVPYLTGAAVKGLVRSYLENNYHEDDRDALLWQWFGSTSKNPEDCKDPMSTQAGELIFFDAIPIEPVTLGVDVMTPHMGDWYAKGEKEPNQPATVPADWHDPVPVTFLVAKGITLLFSFARRSFQRKPDDKRKDICLSDVEQVLTAALQYAGAGAKTATGYGQMLSQASLEQEKEQERLAQAEKIEGYLKKNNRNNSYFIERSGKTVTSITSTDRINELLNSLGEAARKNIDSGKSERITAYVFNKDVLKVEPR